MNPLFLIMLCVCVCVCVLSSVSGWVWEPRPAPHRAGQTRSGAEDRRHQRKHAQSWGTWLTLWTFISQRTVASVSAIKPGPFWVRFACSPDVLLMFLWASCGCSMENRWIDVPLLSEMKRWMILLQQTFSKQTCICISPLSHWKKHPLTLHLFSIAGCRRGLKMY